MTDDQDKNSDGGDALPGRFGTASTDSTKTQAEEAANAQTAPSSSPNTTESVDQDSVDFQSSPEGFQNSTITEDTSSLHSESGNSAFEDTTDQHSEPTITFSQHKGAKPTNARKLPSRQYIPVCISSGRNGIVAPAPPTLAGSLLEARQTQISIKFGAKDKSQQASINTGIASVKKTFQQIKGTIGHLPPELLGGSGPIDWDLWTRVVEDYHDVVVNEEDQLLRAVAGGIPSEFRGIIWQLVARSKSLQLEELYMDLKTVPSIHEKAIKRDLTRTSFYTNVDAANKAGELFNVIKAYSNFDPDVGYTQGMVFIAVPLIMNVTENECFSLLVTLMKDYGLRELFCPEMKGLHLLLHQFDRLLEKLLPMLFNHLIRQGVRLLMYASQWFLTFFSYKFPLNVVLRIFDMVITQGMEAVLRLALNLMLKNEQSLLRLNFEALLEYLKTNLFSVYISENYIASEGQENRRFSLLARKPAAKAADYYKLDSFIQDAMLIELSPLDLQKYEIEFERMILKDISRKSDIESLREQNGKLRHEIKTLETQLFSLNHDHMDSVQALVDTKVHLPEILGDISELNEVVAGIETDIKELEAKLGANRENIPQDIEDQIQTLLSDNAAETERFANLEEELSQLTLERDTLVAEMKKNKKWFWGGKTA